MEIKGEKDLVSLVTCTPFGINSHRLIVTGYRVDYKEKEYIKIKPQLPSVREIIVTVFPILFVVSIVVIEIKNRIQTYRRQREERGGRRTDETQKKNIMGRNCDAVCSISVISAIGGI